MNSSSNTAMHAKMQASPYVYDISTASSSRSTARPCTINSMGSSNATMTGVEKLKLSR